MHLLSKIRCNLLSPYYNDVKTPMRMHFIIPHHIIHVVIYASTISYSMIMHIGSSEGITLWEFNEEEEEEQPETP